MSSENFTLTNTTKAKLPRLAFVDMKNAILGPDYDLSVTIVSEEKIQELNRIHRDKDVPTDILSFPLDETNGEMYINPEQTAIEAKKFDRPYENFFAFLFIHGLVHLKGFDHGSTMESIEADFRKQFGV
ncbi:rRNA maturation RNase YbeY [bacterium]|nr:rRNA maturation RNase YbeY [bacterium]